MMMQSSVYEFDKTLLGSFRIMQIRHNVEFKNIELLTSAIRYYGDPGLSLVGFSPFFY